MAIQRYMAENNSGSIAANVAEMSERYRQGRASDKTIDLNAYLVARLPATYAAVHYCLREMQNRAPELLPLSMLDVGSGPGTASWASVELWPQIQAVTFLDNNARFLELAARLSVASSNGSLQNARSELGNFLQIESAVAADLVVAAYALAEIPVDKTGNAARSLWQVTRHALAIIEPGTPQGFARIRQARESLIELGAHILAPCTHTTACPMVESDWCHFSVRLPRSRDHMHAKRASVPYEDERFSYLIASRSKVATNGLRILSPPVESKSHMGFRLCTENGVTQQSVAKRDKAEYKRIRKAEWGDLF